MTAPRLIKSSTIMLKHLYRQKLPFSILCERTGLHKRNLETILRNARLKGNVEIVERNPVLVYAITEKGKETYDREGGPKFKKGWLDI